MAIDYDALLAKGHPLGATGLAQCAELVWQLRGQAGKRASGQAGKRASGQAGVRRVQDARIGLQHNLGLGGACVVTLLERV